MKEEEYKLENLKRIFKTLQKQGKVETQTEFAKEIKIPQSNMSAALNGDERYLTNNIFKKIYARFGNVLAENQESDNTHILRYWVDSSATAGGRELYEDTQTNEYEDLVVPGFSDCTDAVNLFGDSMTPLFEPGEIIILRPWTDRWIDYGQIYLIITTSGYRMVKYLQPANDEGHVICESANTTYKPFEIPKSDILKLYLVKGAIHRRTM